MFLLPQQDTNPPAIPEDLVRCYYRISPNLHSVASNLITFLDCLPDGHGNDRQNMAKIRTKSPNHQNQILIYHAREEGRLVQERQVGRFTCRSRLM